MTKYNKQAICQTANTLRKKGYTLSQAFRKSWELAKNITSKVSGVSFGKRPVALARLTGLHNTIRSKSMYSSSGKATISTTARR